MRSYKVTVDAINEIRDLFHGRQFAECLERITRERRYMNGGCGWSAEYPMSRAFVKERLNYWQAQSENLLTFV